MIKCDIDLSLKNDSDDSFNCTNTFVNSNSLKSESQLDSDNSFRGIHLFNALSTSNNSNDTLKKLCLVCNDIASGLHYGIASCEACKAFFKRTIQGNVEYTCPSNETCLINKRRRKACQACRYKKCLAVGMLKEGVRMDRVRGGRQKYKRGCSLISIDCLKSTDIKTKIDLLTDIEPVKVYAKIDQSLSDDMTRFTMALSDLADRELVATVGWAKNVPGFSEISLIDQMVLLQNTWIDIFIFNIAFRSMPYNGSLVYSDDFICSEEKTLALNSNILMPLDNILRKLCSKVSSLLLLKEEYFLFKQIILFNPAASLSMNTSIQTYLGKLATQDLQLKDQDLIQKNRDRNQDILQFYHNICMKKDGIQKICSLLFLFPLIYTSKAYVIDFWNVVKQEGFKLHKLLSEMLDFMQPII